MIGEYMGILWSQDLRENYGDLQNLMVEHEFSPTNGRQLLGYSLRIQVYPNRRSQPLKKIKHIFTTILAGFYLSHFLWVALKIWNFLKWGRTLPHPFSFLDFPFKIIQLLGCPMAMEVHECFAKVRFQEMCLPRWEIGIETEAGPWSVWAWFLGIDFSNICHKPM